MKPKLLIFSSRTTHNAPRIIREVHALSGTFDIFLTGSTPLEQEGVSQNIYQDDKVPFTDRLIHYIFRKFTKGRLSSLRFPFTLKQRSKLIEEIKPEIVIIHEPENIPYFVYLKKKYNFKLLFNAHEYHPLEFEDRPGWMGIYGAYYHRLYAEYLKEIDILINVCDSIAEKCKENYGKDSLVIPNAAPYYKEISVKETSQFPIKIIHHGVAIKERSIEVMIEAIEILGPQYTLDLMLMNSDEQYYNQLLERTKGMDNVKLITPVKFNEIVSFINKYDIGLFNLPPNNYNYKVALPNKLFEFIQARLCIVVSPSIEMKRIVEENNLGVVSTDYSGEAIATAIKNLSFQDINRYKHNADVSAALLSAEKYNSLLIEAINTRFKNYSLTL